MSSEERRAPRYRPFLRLEPDPAKLEKLVAALKRRGNPDCLVEVLHVAQETFGYLDRDVILCVSKLLGLPPSKVLGVATFYNAFSLMERGKHVCAVYMGTACYVKGASEIVAAIEREFNVRPGETSPDGKLTLLLVRCIGVCGTAPNIVLDGRVIGNLIPEAAVRVIREVLEAEEND